VVVLEFNAYNYDQKKLDEVVAMKPKVLFLS
jgi:hypothetical protein